MAEDRSGKEVDILHHCDGKSINLKLMGLVLESKGFNTITTQANFKQVGTGLMNFVTFPVQFQIVVIHGTINGGFIL